MCDEAKAEQIIPHGRRDHIGHLAKNTQTNAKASKKPPVLQVIKKKGGCRRYRHQDQICDLVDQTFVDLRGPGRDGILF